MGLKDIGETLPPGFRFYPSDEELVCHYLYKKISNEEALKGTLVEIDLHICEPWQLPDVAKLNATEWYFFSFRDRKYATGFRTNRATTSGYWKATGKDRVILDPRTRQVVGMRKTLVFYRNRAPNGIKTAWIMHEFRMETPHMPPKEDWVLCRVFHKGKEGPESVGRQDLRIFEAVAAARPAPSFSPSAARGYERSDSLILNPTSEIQTQTEIPGALDSALLQLLRRSNPNAAAATTTGGGGADSFFVNDDMVMETSKNDGDDGYGFMWEMGLDDESLGHGVAYDHHHHHQFGDVGFEDDNGIVLL